MKIKYEHSEENICSTPCPYGFQNGYTGKIKFVGSISCSDCRYYVNINNKQKWVECDFSGERVS